MEGTGCVGALFADVFQLLSFFPGDSKLQVSFRGTDHLHIQEREFVVRHNLNSIFLFGGRGVRSVCPYFRGEFNVLVSRSHVHRFLKLFKLVLYLTCLLFALENHQAVISIDAMVDCWAENRLSFLKEARSYQFRQ